MQSFKLYTGNRLGLLAGELVRVIGTSLPSPFDPEIILVQSKGMERWISMQIASRLGVCANIRFPFPNAFLDSVFRAAIPDLADSSIYDPVFCAWRIMEILPGLLERPGFETLKNYLDGGGTNSDIDSDTNSDTNSEPGAGPGSGPDQNPTALKLLQLSKRIADVFDQYAVYRRELIEEWESGLDSRSQWQATLWREISRGREGLHRAALGKRLLQTIRSASSRDLNLPERISLFGISYLPPFHMQLLAALSHIVEVNVFLLNPCMEYWGDIVSNRDIRRLASGPNSASLSPEDGYFEKGNSLLASMGVLGRDFFDLLVAQGCLEASYFADPEGGSLLAAIQSDILNLRDAAESPEERIPLGQRDRSVMIHSCHGPMREMEVLHDHLLEMFEEDAGLAPRDILVMAPDIESYAPFIQAVFGAPEDEEKRIPFSITDRSMRKESRIIDTFLNILDLRGERITAPQVLAVLEALPVRSTFGLTDSDLDLIVKWVRDVRIRWGIDENNRLRWCSEAFRENTWSAGTDRLLLGYAMPGGDEKLFRGILPYDHIEGSEASVLGSLLAFLERLFEFLRSMEEPRTLGRWADHLRGFASGFFTPDDDSKLEMNALLQTLADLKKIETVSGFSRAVDSTLISRHLAGHMEHGGFGLGFLTGGVTFCSMLPMRSIPFKVICLIGMNESDFPRRREPVEFDLIAKQPAPGDRSVRNEDRYLFLEAVLSARDRLYISYTGQSCLDNGIIPPSVLVSELADYINKGFRPPDDGDSPDCDWFITKHRLQAFNPAYFRGDTKLFSYSREHLAEARSMLLEKGTPELFIPGALSEPDETFMTTTVSDLCRFFAHPARFLLNRRLGIYLEEEDLSIEDTECFDLDGLEKHSMAQDLVESAMNGCGTGELFPAMKASGRLPLGTPGECAFKEMSKGVESFSRCMEPYLRSGRLEPLDVDIRLGEFSLTGRLHSIYPERMIRYRYATAKAKDYLGMWIMHLVLNICAAPGYPSESMVVGLDGNGQWHAMRYDPVPGAVEVLGSILELYKEGLTRPLPFFPELSLKYAKLVTADGKQSEDAIAKVRTGWFGSDFSRGESEDAYLRLCFKSTNPLLDPDFARIAEDVFSPLLKNWKDVGRE